MVKFAVELFEFEEFANEEVSKTVSHLSVSNVDHVIIDVKVQLEAIKGIKIFILFLLNKCS